MLDVFCVRVAGGDTYFSAPFFLAVVLSSARAKGPNTIRDYDFLSHDGLLV